MSHSVASDAMFPLFWESSIRVRALATYPFVQWGPLLLCDRISWWFGGQCLPTRPRLAQVVSSTRTLLHRDLLPEKPMEFAPCRLSLLMVCCVCHFYRRAGSRAPSFAPNFNGNSTAIWKTRVPVCSLVMGPGTLTPSWCSQIVPGILFFVVY